MIRRLQRIDYSKTFDKQLRKFPVKIKIAFRKKLELFLKNNYHPLLNNHLLSGKLAGYRSINITGDWRAIYSVASDDEKENIKVFHQIGTHSQLYKG